MKSKEKTGKIWNKNSITIFIVVTLLSVGSVLFVTTDFKNYLVRNSPEWTSTIGRIDTINELTGMNQTRSGNKIIITGYKVEYTYLIEDEEYRAEAFISPLKKEFIYFAFKTKKEWKIEVYYKKGDRTNSYINSNLNSCFYAKTQYMQDKNIKK